MNKIFRYGAKAPTLHLRDIEDRLYEGNQYYNKLVEIERAKREACDAILVKYGPELPRMEARLAELEEAIQSAENAVKKANQEEGRKKRKSPATELRKKRTALNKQVREHKKALRQVDYGPEVAALEAEYRALTAGPNSKQRLDMKAKLQQMKMDAGGYGAEIARVNVESEQAAKTLYAESRLTWMQKNHLTDAFKSACKKHPKFHRYDGHGVLYTQIQGGMLHTEVFEQNQWFFVTGHGRKRYAWIRIDSVDRSPVFTIVPFVMHRDLPACRIKGVSIVRKRCGVDTEWEIQINCEGVFTSDATTNNDCVAIDLGWRHTSTGRKIAHFISDTGEEDELIIPSRMLARWQQVEDLQSIRDHKFNIVLGILRGWLKTHSVPEWLDEATSHIHAWTSQARLARLVSRWRVNRFDGDEAIFHLLGGSPEDAQQRKDVHRGSRKKPITKEQKKHLEHWNGWLCWDRHLYAWQEHLRQKAIRWRLDYYRKFAAGLSRKYGILRMEDLDWSQTMRRSNAEEESNDSIKAGQRFAAPGLLRQCLEQRFIRWERVKAAGTTSTCNECDQPIFIGSSDSGQCACGAGWNRDKNACYNILMSQDVTKSSAPVVQKTPTPLDPMEPSSYDEKKSNSNAS